MACPTVRSIAGFGVFLAALTGCAAGEPEMKPGEWELRGWMENAAVPDMKISEQVYTQRLDATGARFPVSRIIFGEFYRGSSPEHVNFEDGAISGHLEQCAVAPFPKHLQKVSGSYRAESFRIEIEMPVVEGASQIVEGRLIKPLD